MYRSILVPPEVLPAFGSYKRGNTTHDTLARRDPQNANASKRTDAAWAIVDPRENWAITHEKTVPRLPFWNKAVSAPVNMKALVSAEKAVAEPEMKKLMSLPINVQAKTVDLREKEGDEAFAASSGADGAGDEDWELVDGEGVDGDYVMLN